MYPIIIHVGSLVVPAFFFMTMLGVLSCTFYLYFRAPRLGFSQVVVLDCGIIGAIFGILGARLFHVFFEYFWYYKEDP
ncbi:MAG TPA: prolipoprotein diacylglyceryl transferase family protein, partial [bacterium]|nr:prolipoprotein diacylglyceryl transferase family protein [bacterium]